MTYYLAKKPLHNVLFTIIPLLGIVLSFIVSASSYYSDRKLIRAEFNEAVENRYSALKRELDSDLAVLTSLQALYYTSGKDVERSEFRNFTSHILKQYASIQALEWMPRVPDSRREAYERAARREGFPDFQFTERIAQGKMKRAEKRSEYFPVYFVEPYKGNEIALGFDDASTPDRMETLEVARKTGEMRATPRITLVQETRSQFGFIVFAPIYRKGALVNPDQPRWEHLEGFALGVFRIGDIAEKATKYLKPEGVDFSIYDASAPEKERFLYTHSSRTRKTPLLDQEHPGTDFKNSKMIEVAGRKWMVIYSATPDFISARRSWLPWGLLLAGLAFTGLVAGFLVIVRHAGHVEKFAKDLSELNAKLAHEIMERKQIEADLSVKQQQLEELNATLEQRVQEEIVLRQEKEQLLFQQSRMAAMGEMIGAIAHQWRQPLNVIGLIIQNLQMAYEYGELDKERLKNAVATAMWQINFMSKTIDDFRNFFKPSKEKENFD
ncbi:MAG: CHASE domain-containing protein, partial [Dissulfurispiraceae bacterium]